MNISPLFTKEPEKLERKFYSMFSMENIIWMVFNFAIFIIFATFHEYAHGWMAYRCGDPTAKQNGRLSLNPLVHIDFFWTIVLPVMLLLFSGGRLAIGAAKPVPVNPYQLRNPRRDIILVGIAGPSANIAWALLLIFVMKLCSAIGLFMPGSPVYTLLYICVAMNVILLVFNMLPVPPLDGSRVVEGLMPDRYAESYARFSPFMFLALIALMYFGYLNRLFGFVLGLVAAIFHL